MYLDLGIAFARVEKDDSWLSVDGLADFLPRDTNSTESTSTALNDSMLEIAGGDYFPDNPPAPAAAGATGDADALGVPDDGGCLPEGGTETQRAAREFRRFAEQFHAFAAECLQRASAPRPTFQRF
jgi:hypothetical protein